MKLAAEHKEEIKERFQQIKTAGHLAELLQWVYEQKFPKRNPTIKVNISSRDLNYYAFKAKKRYVTFEIPKKNGSETRTIAAPRYKLKVIQKCLNEVFNAVFEPHANAYGFIPGKSVADNAKLHVGKNFVYNIDIEGFFPSTEFRRVKTVLHLKPFLLTEEREPLAFLIANLCCEKTVVIKDGKEKEISSLPQGAPTSPTLTNVVCQRLDRRLSRLAKRYGAVYSRYADDITFSAHTDIFNTWFKARLKVIIERQENYKIKLEKERLQDWNKRQEVTGVVVNAKANVRRRYIKDIRFWLNCWERNSAEFTQALFEKFYPGKKGQRKDTVVPFQNYLKGKILYLGMVRGRKDAMYERFMHRFANQQVTSPMGGDTVINLAELMDVWEQKGIEAAVNLFTTRKNEA